MTTTKSQTPNLRETRKEMAATKKAPAKKAAPKPPRRHPLPRRLRLPGRSCAGRSRATASAAVSSRWRAVPSRLSSGSELMRW